MKEPLTFVAHWIIDIQFGVDRGYEVGITSNRERICCGCTKEMAEYLSKCFNEGILDVKGFNSIQN